MIPPKRIVLVGCGSRAYMYVSYLAGPGRAFGHQFLGLCDINPGRMELYNRLLDREHGLPPVATAGIDDFERLIREQRADTVIVTSIDRTHDEYICRAMEVGCDVITEKPMTTDEAKCRRILRTCERTGRRITVTFNYRYAPRNSRVKELLMEGVIGKVTSVHFEWLLDTKHGADYFRRWHRDKVNSGGLLVHKCTHHFDLVNWWLDASPRTVMAMGGLVFYGRANAESRGVRAFYHRGTGSATAARDPFALQMTPGKGLGEMYLDHEDHDGYLRDLSVFGDGISIEDDVGVLVRYTSGAVMSYHLTAYSPWEGFRVMFNGTGGRLEYEVIEKPYVSGGEDDHNLLHNVRGGAPYEIREPATLLLRPLWGGILRMDMPESNEGGHGGGDIRMLRDIFEGVEADPLGRAAGHLDGARSILTGIAANRSLVTGLPVDIRDLRCLPEED